MSDPDAARRTSAGRQLLQPDEFADAMINVNDQIANLQIAKIGKKCPRQISPLLRGRRSSSKTSVSA